MTTHTYTIYNKDGKPLAGDALPIDRAITAYADAHDGYIKDDITGEVIYPPKEA
jgi:hypothetical protein